MKKVGNKNNANQSLRRVVKYTTNAHRCAFFYFFVSFLIFHFGRSVSAVIIYCYLYLPLLLFLLSLSHFIYIACICIYVNSTIQSIQSTNTLTSIYRFDDYITINKYMVIVNIIKIHVFHTIL